MGARLVNAKKKAKRRAHKKSPEQREAQMQLARQQNDQRRAANAR